MRVQVTYPEIRVISVEMLQGWASDYLADKQGIIRTPNEIPVEEAAQIVNDEGNEQVHIIKDEGHTEEVDLSDRAIDSDPYDREPLTF